jgi:hypothetical protein
VHDDVSELADYTIEDFVEHFIRHKDKFKR